MTVQAWIISFVSVLVALAVTAVLVRADAPARQRPEASAVEPYQRPSHWALLRGTACIPLRELLLNRAIPAIHSYSRSVACE